MAAKHVSSSSPLSPHTQTPSHKHTLFWRGRYSGSWRQKKSLRSLRSPPLSPTHTINLSQTLSHKHTLSQTHSPTSTHSLAPTQALSLRYSGSWRQNTSHLSPKFPPLSPTHAITLSQTLSHKHSRTNTLSHQHTLSQTHTLSHTHKHSLTHALALSLTHSLPQLRWR